MDVSIFHKGGFKAELEATIEHEEWPDVVFTSIALAQSIGKAWTITDSVDEELLMHCNSFSKSGIEFGTLQVRLND